MSQAGRLAPIAVAVLVIGYILIRQPLSNELAGISLNWVAILVVALGGLLGFLEAVIGVLLLVNKLRRLTEALLIGYMLLVCGALVVHAENIFTSQFLHLTTFGELLLKDITLAISGLLVLVHQGLNTA